MTKVSRKIQLTAMILLFVFGLSNAAEAEQPVSATTSLEDYKEQLSKSNTEGMDYKEYLRQYDGVKRPDREYVIEAKDYVRAANMKIEEYIDYEGSEGISVYTEEQGLIEYEVDVQEEGIYDMSILYYPVEGKSASIQRSIFIDGALPYAQLNLIEFSRIWINAVEEWDQDNRGNDLKPKQIEAPDWITSYLYDSEGYETRRLSVYLTKGSHTITLYSRREPMLLRKIVLSNTEEIKSYADVKTALDAEGAKDTDSQLITIHAEEADRKSSQMLYPSQDKSSPAVYPYSAKELRNNTIGSNSSWRLVGQWLEWDFEVLETGYYNITLNLRQNFVRGIYTSRKIMIDGIEPFQEMSNYGFRYENKWHMAALQEDGGDNYKFYLEAGKHTLRMEAVLGDFSEIISEVQDAVYGLNSIYRKIIRITGVEPDQYRDYNLTKNIPGLAEELIRIRDNLERAMDKLTAAAGKRSNREAVIVSMIDQLNYVIKDVERFTKSLAAFKIDMSALGNWVTQVLEQPLALDTIYIHSPNAELPQVKDSLWDRFMHMVKTLYYSFVIDYNTIGNAAEPDAEAKNITVWIGSGRDQANVIKALIDEAFTPVNNINVNVQLVDMGTLLQATLSGQGPDVAVQVGSDLPMNYGMRDAVVDLTEFDDLAKVKTLFRESAMVPYEFGGHTYALPDTETCLMMFYRRDILEELELEIPATWDEMKIALSVLSKNQMDLGMLPAGDQVFNMLLFQEGGEYYNADATMSALDSDVAIRAFRNYTEFYTDYRLEREAPVDQRFRTGEAPIVISDYTLYNILQVSAPDIKGLWGFTKVPGTVREDNTIDYSVSSAGSATVMLKQTKDKASAWEFMKWWAATDTQIQYSRELEALMGAAARYPTANMEAFEKLPWPSEDYEALQEQFEWLKGVAQVPGGYYSWRNVNNAFYKVVLAEEEQKMMPREALTDHVRYINDEITFKRAEFGLPTAEDHP